MILEHYAIVDSFQWQTLRLFSTLEAAQRALLFWNRNCVPDKYGNSKYIIIPVDVEFKTIENN